MKYLKFKIENYRGIKKPLEISIKNSSLVPLIGINECGKTTILQGIYCFDSANDKEYGGKHLKDTLNLYSLDQDSQPIITAEITGTKKEFREALENFNTTEEYKEDALRKQGRTYKKKEIDVSDFLNIANSPISIRIQRNLKTKAYSFDDKELNKFDFIIEHLLRYMPYILYNDDFMDRPPSHIDIPEDEPSEISDWLAIIDRLFKRTTTPTYSIFQVSELDDSRRVDSIISDVEEELNKRLSKAWRTFNLSRHGSLDVKFKLTSSTASGCKKRLEINIIEKIGRRERYFNVVDRSKGFLWFFNFVMKLEFNPKAENFKNDTIHLLDEPGSYLHPSAQEKLCAKLKEISTKEGNVIYCTHSHHLLNPEYIPVKNIYIVEKDQKKNITCSPLPSCTTLNKNQNAYQPLLEAFQIPSFKFIDHNKPILAVEGIYDRYVLEIMINESNQFYILPGTNAHSIISSIQYLICFKLKYVAIWDNDKEGNKEKNKAIDFFGDHESTAFISLPMGSQKTMTMNKMFSERDFQNLKTELKLHSDANYESVIASWYFAPPKIRNSALKRISSETMERFVKLSKKIDTALTD